MPGSKNKLNNSSESNSEPLVSIITPTYDSEEFIEDNLESVANQSYPNVEHVIVDGGSTDGTLRILEEHKDEVDELISGEDEGIFDAMNKGIELAKGEVIGILNSDDVYHGGTVIEKVVNGMQNSQAEICWGDMVYVKRDNVKKIVRFWQSYPYKKGLFARGWEPPHPTVFVKKEVYEQFGKYDLDFPVSADYEFLLRVLEKHRIDSCYIPEVLVKMRTGGNSDESLRKRIRGNIENYRAWKKNSLTFPKLFFIRRIINKAKQFFTKNNYA